MKFFNLEKKKKKSSYISQCLISENKMKTLHTRFNSFPNKERDIRSQKSNKFKKIFRHKILLYCPMAL